MTEDSLPCTKSMGGWVCHSVMRRRKGKRAEEDKKRGVQKNKAGGSIATDLILLVVSRAAW
jgi:hypothetical protein